MKCPICNEKLEQETYYSEIYEDTSYYNYCPNCGYDDYPDEYEDCDEYDELAWKDGSEISCKDISDSECTGHCMSCSYRTL